MPRYIDLDRAYQDAYDDVHAKAIIEAEEYELRINFLDAQPRTHIPKTLYLCDLRACEKCSPECTHTSDLVHAAHFRKLADDLFVEQACAERWIPTKAKLPPVFVPVIVCRRTRAGDLKIEAGQLDVNGWWKVYGHKCKTVTHWMSLPAPPEE